MPLGTQERTISRLQLLRTGGGVWDTLGGNGQWVLGVAESLDAAQLRNSTDSSVSFKVADGGRFVLLASDNGGLFDAGAVLC